MKRKTLLSLLLFIYSFSYSQIENTIYELGETNNLLNEDVKKIISDNLENKKVVFLGEAEHHIGSDFLAKTEFVKFLVSEKGYKNIAFESDFFGLYFDHKQYNTFYHWSNSIQCQELFKFLEKNKVTIWGFDNQMHSYYTYHNFVIKLKNFFEENAVQYDTNFIAEVEKVIKAGSEAKKSLSKNEFKFIIDELDTYLSLPKVVENKIWHQFLKSFKAIVQQYSESKKTLAIAIRDKQMAENLNFLIKSMPEQKFIVWLANGHMAKYDYEFMKGQTMGAQFVALNQDISYHIAVSSIHMPYRKENYIKKLASDKENLLHFLPSTDKNYFIDSKQLLVQNPEYSDKKYNGMFNLNESSTNWFKHFDALVFISKGEKIEYIK